MIICRMCQSRDLHQYLDLGFTPLADHFPRTDQLKGPEIYYPLEVFLCNTCGLSQLSVVVSPEELYRRDYPYESSITKTGARHWRDFARTVVERFGFSGEDLVVDVGSNVGVLLEAFTNEGMQVQGIDPAANIVMIAQERGIDTICDFFNRESVDRIVSTRGRASVVTATNVLAHIDNLYEFVENLDLLLADRGVFIFEAPYLVNLVNQLQYDTIYHEHLSYFSVRPLVDFFERFSKEIFHIEEVDIHGGSFRIYVGNKGAHEISVVIRKLRETEDEMELFSTERLKEFAIAVEKNRDDLVWMLRSLKREGKRIAGVSAPAKGMTLLNYCNIGKDILDFVTEKSTLKIGRFTPGAHIPVMSDSELLEQKTDYALLLAWNFADEIIENLAEFREAGGKFIIPIPEPRIVG